MRGGLIPQSISVFNPCGGAIVALLRFDEDRFKNQILGASPRRSAVHRCLGDDQVIPILRAATRPTLPASAIRSARLASIAENGMTPGQS